MIDIFSYKDSSKKIEREPTLMEQLELAWEKHREKNDTSVTEQPLK